MALILTVAAVLLLLLLLLVVLVVLLLLVVLVLQLPLAVLPPQLRWAKTVAVLPPQLRWTTLLSNRLSLCSLVYLFSFSFSSAFPLVSRPEVRIRSCFVVSSSFSSFLYVLHSPLLQAGLALAHRPQLRTM